MANYVSPSGIGGTSLMQPPKSETAAGSVADYDSNFFQNAHETILDWLNKSTNGQTSHYTDIAYTLGKYGIMIYVLWYAFTVVMGKQKSPVHDFIWNLARFWIILLFVRNIDGWLDSSVNAIYALKDTFSGGDIYVWLDQLWVKTVNVANIVFAKDKSDYVPMAGAIGAFFTYAGGMLALLVSCIVFISAEINLIVLTVTAPLFIICLSFGFLRQMFNNWLQLIFSSLLVFLFGGLAVRAGTNLLNTILTTSLQTADESNLIYTGASALAAGVLMALIIWKANVYASQIASVGADGALQGAAAMGLGAATFGGSKLLGAGLKGGKNFTGGAWKGIKREEKGLSNSTGVAGKLGNLAGQGTNMAYKRGKAAVDAARKKYGN